MGRLSSFDPIKPSRMRPNPSALLTIQNRTIHLVRRPDQVKNTIDFVAVFAEAQKASFGKANNKE